VFAVQKADVRAHLITKVPRSAPPRSIISEDFERNSPVWISTRKLAATTRCDTSPLRGGFVDFSAAAEILIIRVHFFITLFSSAVKRASRVFWSRVSLGEARAMRR